MRASQRACLREMMRAAGIPLRRNERRRQAAATRRAIAAAEQRLQTIADYNRRQLAARRHQAPDPPPTRAARIGRWIAQLWRWCHGRFSRDRRMM